jgi:SPP1 family predicted phage head-tail adaptor
MKAGQLRHRVTLQSPTESQTGYGEPTLTWSTVSDIFASVEPLSGRERWNAQQFQSEATHQVRMRYRSGVTSKMRIVWGSRTFHFMEPPRNTEERNVELIVLAKEMP